MFFTKRRKLREEIKRRAEIQKRAEVYVDKHLENIQAECIQAEDSSYSEKHSDSNSYVQYQLDSFLEDDKSSSNAGGIKYSDRDSGAQYQSRDYLYDDESDSNSGGIKYSDRESHAQYQSRSYLHKDERDNSSREKKDSAREPGGIKYSDRGTGGIQYSDRGSGEIKYSSRDLFDSKKVTKIIMESLNGLKPDKMLGRLNDSLNQTFVEKVNNIVWNNNLKDSDVYKAAQIDRRLYSKMMANPNYQPSKDTALALAFALHMSLDQANDLLERAGYTLSHSNKRDVIIEYFFKDHIFNLDDINGVLYEMGEKTIGRF